MERWRRKIFVSATSPDLKSYRADVCNELLRYEDEQKRHPFSVESQENFDPDYRALPEVLRARVSDCDAMICLVGSLYGAEPPGNLEPRRSYTQIEYDLAHQFDIPVYVFFPSAECILDSQTQEDDIRRQLQQQHRQAIEEKNLLWGTFSDHSTLCLHISRLIPRLRELPDAKTRYWIKNYTKKLLEREGRVKGPFGYHTIDEVPDLQADWEARVGEDHRRYDSLQQAFTQNNRLAVIGCAGAGKSIAMKRLLRALIELHEEDKSRPIPIWLRASHLEAAHSDRSSIEEFIANEIRGIIGKSVMEDEQVEDLLTQSRACLLMDGFDELPDWKAVTAKAALWDFLDSTPSTHIVISSRPGFLPAKWGLVEVDIPPLSKEGQRRLIRLWTSGGQVEETKILGWLDTNASPIASLAELPFYLSALLELSFGRKGAPPDQPGLIIQEILSARIRRECSTHARTGIWAAFAQAGWSEDEIVCACFQALGRLGFHAFINDKTKLPVREALSVMGKTVDLEWREREIPEVSGRIDALARAIEPAGLFEIREGSLEFTHALWRDFLAAHEMARRIRAGDDLPAEAIAFVESSSRFERTRENQFSEFQLPACVEKRWEMFHFFLAGLVDEADSSALLKHIVSINSSLAAYWICCGRARAGSECEHLIELFVQDVERAESDLARRLLAARALGRVGDPRVWKEGARQLAPRMIKIPQGQYRIGLSQKDLRKAFDVKLEGIDVQQEVEAFREVSLTGFEIGKYPVTNAQFEQFITAGGYRQPDWWTDADYNDDGWEWLRDHGGDNRLPDYWRDPRYNQPNQPVVGITCYEAEAYCRWLTKKTGRRFMLPTLARWQAAARGLEGRLFPWGDAVEASRCNCWHEAYLGGASPVGIFPAGATPEGAEDMAGNIAEFCRSDENESLFVCGGSWLSAVDHCRTTLAQPCERDAKSSDFGFRVLSPDL
jgi:formylglycine-generating enzyme required for sulfatase activity